MAAGKLAYFDNAATSFPKPECVYAYADDFYRTAGANAGRGQYQIASKANALIEETRASLLSLYRCENKQVIFTSSATEAINKILFGLSLKPEMTIYLSPFEHNSVTRVVHAIAKMNGVRIEILPFDSKTLLLNVEETVKAFSENAPSVVVATHASNVCGVILPVDSLFSLAKSHGAITVLDMSQTTGLLNLKLSSDDIDYAVFAGHKSLLAPFGIGGFICKKTAMLEPVFHGGTGVDSIRQEPAETLRERMEVGSPNIYALAGLNASLTWISNNGLDWVCNEERKRARRLLDLLHSFSNVKIIADVDTVERIGVVSTLFNYYCPDEMGGILSQNAVAVRTGLHCSPYAHEFLGTSPTGSVRFSVSCLSTDQDFEILNEALEIINKAG